MTELDDYTRKQLRKARKLRQLNKIEIETGVKSETLSDLAKKGMATDRVVRIIQAHFAPKETVKKDAVAVVCEHYQIEPHDLTKRVNSEARQMAAYMLTITTDKSYVKIAKELGYSSHSDVSHRLKAVNNLLLTNHNFIRKALAIRGAL